MFLSQIEERALSGLSEKQKTAVIYGGEQDYEGNADLALVLGGQMRECGARAKTAADLYLDGRVRYLMPTGGVSWDTPFGHISEAELLARYMREAGVPEDAVKKEEMAENTKENMLFAGVQIIRQLRREPIRRIILVTSAFHMRRSLAVARWYLPRQYEIFPVRAHAEADTAEDWMTLEYRVKRVDIELINLQRDILKGIGEDIELPDT